MFLNRVTDKNSSWTLFYSSEEYGIYTEMQSLIKTKLSNDIRSLGIFNWEKSGSAKANGREPKTGLGRVFNYKLGCSDAVHVIMYTEAHPYL